MTIDTIYHYAMAVATVVIGILMLAEPKGNRKDTVFKIVVPLILLSFFTFIWKRYFISLGTVTLARSSIVIALGTYALFFSKYNFYTKLLLISTYYTINIFMRDLSFVLVFTLKVATNDDLIFDLVKFIIFITLLIITGLYIKKYRLIVLQNISRHFRTSIALIITLYCLSRILIDILVECNVMTFESSRYFERFLFGIIIILLNLIVYHILYTISTYYSYKEELVLLKQKQTEIMADIMRVNKMNDDIRVLRHEFKNNILMIQGLARTKKYTELDNYLESYLKTDASVLSYIDCGNPVINNILNYKKADLEAKGVSFNAMVSVPEKLPFKDIDIISLLANLIDNAAEASMKTEQPNVSLNVNIEKGYCFITVVNPVIGEVLNENPSLKTTKDDKSNHGLGLRIVHNIVEKYDGHICFEQKNREFYVSIMLSLD